MANYLSLAIPANMTSIANSIAVAFEPDISINIELYDTFTVPCKDQNGVRYMAYGAEVSDVIYSNFQNWKDNPEILCQLIDGVYSSRFQVDPPTLEDCVLFCENVLLSNVYGIYSGLAEMMLEIEYLD